jgi:hypothetical protein
MSEETPKSEDEKPAALEQEPAAAPTHRHGHLPHLPSGFLEKLKRRNVGRVAILYVVVCYVILEPFEMFFHLLELPAWTGRTVTQSPMGRARSRSGNLNGTPSSIRSTRIL